MSQVVTDSAEDSHHFLSAGPALPVFDDRRQQDIQPSIPGGGSWCISQNHLSLHPSPQRAGGGPAAPSPTSSPKAQAPWQRPRRQGGVCQRHLSLTSSITGHHGNTHDSTQEGLSLSSPPSVPSSVRASAEPKLETPVPPGSEKPDSLPTLSSRLIQTMASGGPVAASHQTHTNFTLSGVQAPPLRYTRDWGMLLSHTPKSSKA